MGREEASDLVLDGVSGLAWEEASEEAVCHVAEAFEEIARLLDFEDLVSS